MVLLKIVLLLHVLIEVYGFTKSSTTLRSYSSTLSDLQQPHTNIVQPSKLTMESVLLNQDSHKSVTIEILSKKKLNAAEKRDVKTVAYSSVYRETKQNKMADFMESPVVKAFEFLTNPLALCLAMYFSALGFVKFQELKKYLSGKGNKKEGPVSVEDLVKKPIFECESCGMEMRPARGRAQAIFSRPKFRCARCGAKASAYFDVDDMNDPRAVARKERLEREKDEADDEAENEE